MYKLFGIVSLTCLVLGSCHKKNDCSLADITCAVNTTIGLSIRDAVTGADLVFTNTAIYNSNDLRLFSVQGGDTTFYPYQVNARFNNSPDSLLLAGMIFPWPQKLYIRLANEPIDSLAIRYVSQSEPCECPVSYIESLQLNRDTVMRNSKNIVIIRK